MTATITTSDIGTAVADLAERLRRRPGAWCDGSELPRDVVDELMTAGAYRLGLPRELGGAGLALPVVSELIQSLATADGSVGWCAMVANMSVSLLASLPRGEAEHIAADPDQLCIAGGYAPSGRAQRTGDLFTIDGRWSFASGCTDATWLLGGVLPVDGAGTVTGQPIVAFFPAAAATIEPNWDVSGLRATGSHDVVVEGIEVPASRTCSLVGDRWSHDPIARLPFFTLGPALMASVLLGLGQRALEEITVLAHHKTPFGRSNVLAADDAFQEDLAAVTGDLRSAQASLRSACAVVHDAASTDGNVGSDEHTEMSLCAHVARRAATSATTFAFEASGTDGIRSKSAINRCFQDAHVASRHVALSSMTARAAGRALLDRQAAEGSVRSFV